MIKIDTPALALNDTRLRAGHYHLSRNIKVRPDDSRENLVACVAAVAAGQPGGKLKNLVLNSHALPGLLIMGEGFWGSHTGLFERWSGLIDNIWITSCEIASRNPPSPDSELPDGVKGQPGDGYVFCREMAMRARCNVIASSADQDIPNHGIPDGYIDSFEGMVFCFQSTGDLAWSHRYALHNRE